MWRPRLRYAFTTSATAPPKPEMAGGQSVVAGGLPLVLALLAVRGWREA